MKLESVSNKRSDARGRLLTRQTSLLRNIDDVYWCVASFPEVKVTTVLSGYDSQSAEEDRPSVAAAWLEASSRAELS